MPSALWLTTLAAAALAGAGDARAAPDREVRAVVARLFDAWNRHDMAAFAALYADDAEFVNVIGMRWHGRPEIEAQHVALHAGRMRATRLTEVATTVRPLAPGVALAQSVWELRGDAGAPGWKIGEVRRGVFAHVLVRSGSRWAIVYSQNTDAVDLPNH